MTDMLAYQHTQRGPWWLVLVLLAVTFFTVGWFSPLLPMQIGFTILGLLIAILVVGFVDLTVEDEGDHLQIRFGPVPLFRRRVRYDEIQAVAPGRTTLLDGWGIHWNPMSGWVWNLWGRDCVVLHLRRGKLKIGTDDRQGLIELLRSKTSSTVAPSESDNR